MNSSTKTTFTKYGVAASVVSTSIAVAASTGVAAYTTPVAELSDDNTPVFSNSATNKSGRFIIKEEYYPENNIEKWTSKNEKQFSRLLVLTHTHKATLEQRLEFKRLRSIRSKLRSSRSAEEIITEIKRAELLDSALKSLEQYATLAEQNKKG